MPRRASTADTIEVREVSPGHIALHGILEYETARRAHEQGLALIAESRESRLEVDCSQISRADSAALAVLIDWMAVARARRLRLCVVNVPQHLRAIARISEVEELLEQGVDCGSVR